MKLFPTATRQKVSFGPESASAGASIPAWACMNPSLTNGSAWLAVKKASTTGPPSFAVISPPPDTIDPVRYRSNRTCLYAPPISSRSRVKISVLPAPADSMLVEELAADGRVVPATKRRRYDSLVFRKGLFGDEGARHVEVATRPSPLSAEAANMLDQLADLLVRQLVPEGRHHRIERADGAAPVDDRRPVEIGLRRGQVAIREIGGLGLEPANRDRLPTAVSAVARDARGVVQLLPAEAGARGGLRVEPDAQKQDRQEGNDDRHERANGNMANHEARNLRTVLNIWSRRERRHNC